MRMSRGGRKENELIAARKTPLHRLYRAQEQMKNRRTGRSRTAEKLGESPPIQAFNLLTLQANFESFFPVNFLDIF